LIEKDANLSIALFLADDLRAAGYTPALTRTKDTGANLPARDLNGDGVIDNDDDLQARVDIANGAGASLLLSIHNNGAGPSRRGTITYYSQAHPLGKQSKALAGLIQKEFISGLRGEGYEDVIDEGISDDAPLGKPFGHLFVIGPKTPRVARVAKMPGALGETLFVTNETEAALLATKRIQQAIALAYARAVDKYFAQFSDDAV
jgi:N-acetylmuramoyl-L-alanine amidase